jgi:hypothetical protein
MIDAALSTLELVQLWLDLRDAGSPEAEHFRQALLARLNRMDGRDALPIVRLAWGAGAYTADVDESVEEVGTAAYDAHHRWVQAYVDQLKKVYPNGPDG